ncbi:MAG TPA: hypothetical protein VHC69_29945 [Polyangiaceae bacterium]|nr:hypothetical protein [Polyangiaceae bacterium]
MPERELSPVAVLIAIVIAALSACSSDKSAGESGPNPARGVYIPLTWQTARTTTGHRIHVGGRHIECTRCHELTGTTIGRVSPERCRACHEKEGALVHAANQARTRFGPTATADCTSCHAFTASQAAVELGGSARDRDAEHSDGGPLQAPPPDCLRCHRVAQGHVPAIAIHVKGNACLSCHRPHEDATPKPAPCLDCHRDVSPEHAAHGGEGGCKGCHERQHGKAEDALGTCASCHASHEPRIPATALFAKGHDTCESCHRPHDFQKALVTPCRSCHDTVHALADTAVTAHQRCTSCHDPHDVRGSPRAACTGCHSNLHPDHPKLAGAGGPAGVCVGCHDPHPPSSAHGIAKPCTSCHATAASDVAFHHGTECEQCHKPHDFVLDDGGKAVCHQCHEAKLAAVAVNPGHQACAGCHGGLPHQPASGAGSCTSCHMKEHDRANPGHQACTNCHEPHAGAVQAPCKSCHAVEARTAPSGHAACLNCHEQHSGAPENAACARCHGREAQTKHGQISATCTGCHQPHGPAPPSAPPPCQSCHEPARLPGLHTAGKHTDCRGCHSGHDDPAAAMRAPCLACHTDRKDHFPDAPRCASCHLFESGAGPPGAAR